VHFNRKFVDMKTLHIAQNFTDQSSPEAIKIGQHSSTAAVVSHDHFIADEETYAALLDDIRLCAPVVFLDFDGVTHPEPCIDKDLFCRLEDIASVLNRYTQVEVVISSSWRNHYKLSELQDFLSAIPPSRIIDVTPSIKQPSSIWLPSSLPEFERQWEIETWMKVNRPWGTPWLAIDDRPRWFAPSCPNLLLTDRNTGFTGSNANVLAQMIEERL
jgi:hypothetical protein